MRFVSGRAILAIVVVAAVALLVSGPGDWAVICGRPPGTILLNASAECMAAIKSAVNAGLIRGLLVFISGLAIVIGWLVWRRRDGKDAPPKPDAA